MILGHLFFAVSNSLVEFTRKKRKYRSW